MKAEAAGLCSVFQSFPYEEDGMALQEDMNVTREAFEETSDLLNQVIEEAVEEAETGDVVEAAFKLGWVSGRCREKSEVMQKGFDGLYSDEFKRIEDKANQICSRIAQAENSPFPADIVSRLESLRSTLEPNFQTDTAVFQGTDGYSEGPSACVAVIVRALFGGQFVSSTVRRDSHWFNRLEARGDGYYVDLTGDQFGFDPVRIGKTATDLYDRCQIRQGRLGSHPVWASQRVYCGASQ